MAHLESRRFLFGYLLGGLRAPVVGLHWLKVDLNFRKGRYFAIEKDLRSLAELNPFSERVWDYAAWHQAYNVARRAASDEKRFHHRYEGLNLARQGLELMPGNRTLLHRAVFICRILTDHHRARFVRAEQGRSPEAVEYGILERLVERPNPMPVDRLLFARASQSLAVRLLIEGDFERAKRILDRGRQEMRRFREAAREAASTLPLPDEIAAVVGAIRSWHEVAARAAAARAFFEEGKRSRARACVDRALEALDSGTLKDAAPADRLRRDAKAVRKKLVGLESDFE